MDSDESITDKLPKVPTTEFRAAATAPASVAGYLLDGEEGIDGLERGIRTQMPAGKYPKRKSGYVPQSPFIPAAWEYKCATCRFYQNPDGGESKCEVVGQEGDAFGGEKVHPEAWCGFWLPIEGQGFFEWARDRLEGDGLY
jgi:hypothetical protein